MAAGVRVLRGVLSVIALTACGVSAPAALPGEAEGRGALQRAVEHAADLEGVPRPLLLALAWTHSRFSMGGPGPTRDGGFGVFHLIDDRSGAASPGRARLSLQRAAGLTGLSIEALSREPLAHARGAAAVLRAEMEALLAAYPDLREERLGDWFQAVMRLSGSSDARVADAYASQVFRLLRDGLSAEGEGGSVRIAPQEFTLTGRAIWGALQASQAGDYCPGGACVSFVPASSANYGQGRNASVTTIVIHDMEGSYTSSISWFEDPSAAASAHYLLRSSDGEITQMVRDADTAWHAGNSAVNHQSIGIEHEGFAHTGGTWFSEAMYQSSAALVRWLSGTYGIPRDRAHIIGHYEVPDPSHTTGGDAAHPGWYGGASNHHDPCDSWSGDPTWHNNVACYWDWAHYMDLISGTSTPAAGTLTGFVLDACCGLVAGTRKPLPGAQVVVQQGAAALTAAAGADGSYTFSLAPGTYTPVASLAGYGSGDHSSVGGGAAAAIAVAAGQTSWGSILLAAVDAGPLDAGVADAGLGDAGVSDAGHDDAGVSDAGLGDAGVSDAGRGDAGVSGDGGAADAAADAGPSAPGLDAGAAADAGPLASGLDAGADAGALASAPSGGCSAGSAGAWALLGLLALRRRRR
jgi:N-acetylmuramoyl-L-alanine amidase/Carboxypeptidase regulatory-like domain